MRRSPENLGPAGEKPDARVRGMEGLTKKVGKKKFPKQSGVMRTDAPNRQTAWGLK